MLSTPSYFKLKPQLRLAAEYDPSTYIEFELRCNSAASTFATGRFYHNSPWAIRYANLHQEPRLMSLLSPPFVRRSSNHTVKYNDFGPRCTLYSIGRTDRRYSTNQRSDMAMTSVIASRSSPLRSPLARSGSWLQTSSPREAQPPRATAAPACPRTARPAFR